MAPEKRAGEPSALANAALPGHRLGLLTGCLAALGQGGGAVLSRKAHALSAAGGLPIDGGTAAFQRILGGLLVVTLNFALHPPPPADRRSALAEGFSLDRGQRSGRRGGRRQPLSACPLHYAERRGPAHRCSDAADRGALRLLHRTRTTHCTRSLVGGALAVISAALLANHQ